MGLHALKEDFDGIVARFSAPPEPFYDSITFDSVNGGPSIEALEQQADAAHRQFQNDMRVWRTRLFECLALIEDLFVKAQDDPEALAYLIEDAVPNAIRVIDENLSSAEARLGGHPTLKALLDWGPILNPSATVFFEKIAALEPEVRKVHADILREFRDRLKAIEWDYDPDARGGETFDTADELIASLRH